MQSVCDQCGRTNPASDPDAVDRDEFIANEADQSGGRDQAEMGDRYRVGQSAKRFHPGDDRGQRDHRDHEESGCVLGAAEAVGVAPGRGPGAECERHPQWDRRQRIGEIVHGVGE